MRTDDRLTFVVIFVAAIFVLLAVTVGLFINPMASDVERIRDSVSTTTTMHR